jgi:nucleotide-binding universal stress UspA family protein
MKKPHIENILVPIDFSEMSIQAIETAKSLARRFDSNIHLAHIHEFSFPAGFMAAPDPIMCLPISAPEESEKKIAAQLRTLATKFGLSTANCHVRTGVPAFDELCRLANELRADLIVTSTHGHSGLKHVLLGSTAERLVQHSSCPVFVARKSGRKFDKILVPVDFSGCSLAGLTYAIQFAERFAARIIVFHAVHLGYAYTSDGYAMYDLSALTKAVCKDADRQMSEFVREATFGCVKFETVIRVGPPVQEICEFARGQDVDLIITPTHGRTGFEHILIGSTAEHVVRHARCPVLVVPSFPNGRIAKLTQRSDRRQITCRVRARRVPRKEIQTPSLTKRDRKVRAHSFPERRKTNRFRQTHLKK